MTTKVETENQPRFARLGRAALLSLFVSFPLFSLSKKVSVLRVHSHHAFTYFDNFRRAHPTFGFGRNH